MLKIDKKITIKGEKNIVIATTKDNGIEIDLFKANVSKRAEVKKLVDFAGCGATVPLTGFGNLLAKGAISEVKTSGLIGAFTGGVKAASGGIAAAIFFAKKGMF